MNEQEAHGLLPQSYQRQRRWVGALANQQPDIQEREEPLA